jgi:hypothetical protein
MTSQEKLLHSPGPWKVIPPQHGHPTEYQCVQFGVDDMYTSLEMLPADAHLCAAAPDLLAGAKAMLAARDSKASVDAVIALRDAIAKAEGRS